MDIFLLIKNYMEVRTNLVTALSYVLDEMSCGIDFSCEDSLDCIRNKIVILDGIVHDIQHVNKTIAFLHDLNEKGV